MKTIPFNESFKIDEFIIDQDMIDRGYCVLTCAPEIDSVCVLIGGSFNIIYPQFDIIEVDLDLHSLFPLVSIGGYIITWFNNGRSSSSSECFLPDPIWELEGGIYSILQNNIGEILHVRYVSQL